MRQRSVLISTRGLFFGSYPPTLMWFWFGFPHVPRDHALRKNAILSVARSSRRAYTPIFHNIVLSPTPSNTWYTPSTWFSEIGNLWFFDDLQPLKYFLRISWAVLEVISTNEFIVPNLIHTYDDQSFVRVWFQSLVLKITTRDNH